MYLLGILWCGGGPGDEDNGTKVMDCFHCDYRKCKFEKKDKSQEDGTCYVPKSSLGAWGEHCVEKIGKYLGLFISTVCWVVPEKLLHVSIPRSTVRLAS